MSFYLPVVIFGVSIAIDVAVITISRFKDTSLTAANWALPLAVTHTVFPAVSYFAFWGAATIAPKLHTVLGIFGFLFITAVVYEILCEALGTKLQSSVTDKLSALFRSDRGRTRHVVIVLSGSWDALLCGPGLLPIAKSGGWSIPMMVGAFLIFGLIVGLVGIASLQFSKKLRARKFTDTRKLANFNLVGTFLELSIIGGFGINSLWSAFSWHSHVYVSIGGSAFLVLVIFTAEWVRLKSEALHEAMESVSGS